jgi:hypothetical protein
MNYIPDLTLEAMSTCNTSSHDQIRICANIKSKKTPDVQCKSKAVNGDYCSKHCKHPSRFIVAGITTNYTYSQNKAAKKIQRAWKHVRPFLRLFHQGVLDTSICMNNTELYSLEPVSSLKALYMFGIIDSNSNLWLFDIRSLARMISIGTLKGNPYTREPISSRINSKILRRISWLRSRGYTTLFPQEAELTSEQIWQQKILDTFMKLEAFGFHVQCEWFNEMSIDTHIRFYKTLYELWNFRLGLTTAQQLAIVPSPVKLFSLSIYSSHQKQHVLHWWEKVNLRLIETLISSSQDKESQRLGAMYCIMGFVSVCNDAGEAFPWILESL